MMVPINVVLASVFDKGEIAQSYYDVNDWLGSKSWHGGAADVLYIFDVVVSNGKDTCFLFLEERRPSGIVVCDDDG